MESAFNAPIRRLQKETAWLRGEFLRASSGQKDRSAQLASEMAVLRLHDAWTRFCRELIIVSAVGRTVTLGGVPLKPSTPNITTRNSVMPLLLSMYRKRRRYEPRWGDAKECVDAAQRLAINNFSTVSAALGATNSPAQSIRFVRNFYAHRKQDTAANAATTNLFSSPSCPTVFELANYVTGGSRVIDIWVTGLVLVAIAAAQ